MGVVQLPDDLQKLIDRQVAEGRAVSQAEFLSQAVQRYAQALEEDDDEIVAAIDEGIADIKSGRFELISGPEDMQRIRAELQASRRHIEGPDGSGER